MASRDWATFAEYVSARSAALHRAAYLMVGDVGLAQDLVQEALIRTYVAWSRLRDPANAEAYTRQAITTIAIDWSRRKAALRRAPSAAHPRPPRRAMPTDHRPCLAVGVPAATAGTATGGHRAPLLRGPHRGRRPRRRWASPRHRQEPGIRRHDKLRALVGAFPRIRTKLTRRWPHERGPEDLLHQQATSVAFAARPGDHRARR